MTMRSTTSRPGAATDRLRASRRRDGARTGASAGELDGVFAAIGRYFLGFAAQPL
jgi:hypothetical protein